MFIKKSDWFFALLGVLAFTIVANMVSRDSRVLNTQSNFTSICGISSSQFLQNELNFGSGILLSDGIHVITNRHVIDRNKNLVIDEDEKSVTCTFFNKKSRKNTISDAKVIWAASLEHFRELTLDLAVIKLPEKVGAGVKLMSIRDYKNLAVGHSIYAIGCPGGKIPPHITFGGQSSQFQPHLQRAGISVWFGNSGGGIFSARSGELLGIVSKLHRDGNGHIIPEWTEYISVERIIPCLQNLGLE